MSKAYSFCSAPLNTQVVHLIFGFIVMLLMFIHLRAATQIVTSDKLRSGPDVRDTFFPDFIRLEHVFQVSS